MRFFKLLCSALVICCLTCPWSQAATTPEPRDQDCPEAVQVQCETFSNNSIGISVQIDGLQTLKGVDDQEVQDLIYLDNEPYFEVVGRPVLPFIARSILVPPTGNIELHLDNVSCQVLSDLNPVLAQVNEDDYNPNITLTENEAGFWPPQVVEIGEPGFLRGYRLVNFRIYPVQYNQATGETKFNQSVKFHVTVDGSSNFDQTYRHPARPSMYAWRAVRTLVENPPPCPSRDELLSASYLYIVPEYDGVDESLAPLLEWRNRQGHKVLVEHVPNNTDRNTIHNIIEGAYEGDHPIEFVALVGDAAQAEFNIPAATQTGDYEYTLIEGNDPLPDVAIGRLSCDDVEQLNRIVNKLVSYESAPYMEDTDWFLQGTVVAGHQGNGLSTILLSKYVRRELLKLGFTEVRHWYHDEDGEIPQNGNQPFVDEAFAWGISVLSYRAYQYMNRYNINNIYDLPNRRGRWPAVLAISCDTGDFTNADGHTEAFLRSRGGGIGAIGTATPQTAPQYNNMMAGGTFRGLYKDGLYAFGWGLNMGKYELWRAYNGLDNRAQNFLDWNNLMGDPGTHIWTGIPRLVEVDHPDLVAIGASEFHVAVFDAEDEVGVADALVCLYKDGEIHQTLYTDAQGIADLPIDPEVLTEGTLMLTVTKHNMHPYLADVEVSTSRLFLGLSGFTADDDAEGESQGNSDGSFNPGERVELEIEVVNFGEEVPEGPFTANLVSLSPLLEVLSEALEFDVAPQVGESMMISHLIQVDPAFPDQERALLRLDLRNEDRVWRSLLAPDVQSPQAVINEVIFEDGSFDPGDTKNVNFSLLNAGRHTLPVSHATLSADNEVITIRRAEGDYPAIAVDEERRAAGQGFSINANPLAIPGMKVTLTLALETESGFTETVSTEIAIGAPAQTDPFGPDDYGYICFDSADEGWEMAPEYDWVEIDPAVEGHDFEGTDLNLTDNGDNGDHSRCVDLPFDFQYYGEVFDQITICTNGWAAFGNQEELADFRNRRIGQAIGPEAQLCVWWDNLITRDNSSILMYHDPELGRLIIEWNNMRRLIGRNQAGAAETFQIILYDPEVNPTLTGDGLILYQYQEVTNENREAVNDTPYCTIGISNLDDSGGLEYTYWNQYPDGAAPINNELAILFTTATSFITGVVRGTVTDLSNNAVIPNALINSNRGFNSLTNENGFYFMDVLVGEDYEFTASAEGFNDSTRIGFAVAEEETVTVDFGLLFSSFTASIAQIEETLEINEVRDLSINIRNEGNGPLAWAAERTFQEGASGLGGRVRAMIAAPEVHDLNLECVAYVDGEYYIAGQNGQEPNMIYVLDSEGHQTREFQQVGGSRTGFPDLTYGNGLIWGSGEREIFGFNLDGELAHTIFGPYENNKALAYDPVHDGIWVHNTNQAVQLLDMQGDWVTAHDCYWSRICGMAYWAEDPDGYCLWLLEDYGEEVAALHKMHPETGDTAFVGILEVEEIGQPCGVFLTDDFGQLGTVFLVLINDYLNRLGDRVDHWQLGSYMGWMTLNADEGVVNPNVQQDLTLTLNSGGMFPSTYEGTISFTHNGRGQEAIIPVTMTVYDPADISDDGETAPFEFAIDAIYPNPFNAATTVKYSIPVPGTVAISIFDISGREIMFLQEEQLASGRHSFSINGSEWSSGVYIVKLQHQQQTLFSKMMMLK